MISVTHSHGSTRSLPIACDEKIMAIASDQSFEVASLEKASWNDILTIEK